MFIKDGVYREIDVKVDAPIAEGTILTFGGTLAAEDASDAFGIVPENIYVLPPTKKTRVVIGGTIDLDDPANKGVEFSEAVVNALGADINFVPAAEAGGGGALIVNSSYDSTANNHVLDKTAQEIYDALLSGTSVYIKYQYGSLSTYVGHLILAPVVRLYNYNYTDVIRILAVRPILGSVNSHAESGIPGVLVYSAGGVDEYPIFDAERSTQVNNPYMINRSIS